MTTYPLTIGTVTLNQGAFEGPNGDQEGFGDLGSKQKAVVHEFPGGIITAQLQGSVPKTLTWGGVLFGFTAIERNFQLQALCDNSQGIYLTWAQWTYYGFVEDYQAVVKGPNEIHYKIVFRSVGTNNTVGGAAPTTSDPFAGTVANAQNTATQQSNAPASGGSLPPTVKSGVSNLNNSVNQALQQSGGSVSNIPSTTLKNLQNQISQIQSILSPIINGSDPIAASAASDLNGTLSILSTAFNNSLNPLITTITAVNPNLYQLAAQYYGDPTLYWVIGAANNLSDPLPITAGPIQLAIPVKPIITSYTPPTVMQDALAAA